MYEDNEEKDEDGREESPEVEPPSGVTSRKAHTGVHIYYIYVHSSPILINTVMMNHKHHPRCLGASATVYWRAANPLGAAVYSFSVRTTAVPSIIPVPFWQKGPKRLQP